MADEVESEGAVPVTATASAPPPPGRWLTKGLKVAIWLLAAIVTFAAVVCFCLFIWGNDKLKAAQDDARKAGLPLTYAELQAQVWGGDGKVPDSENAAPVYEKAFALIPKQVEGPLRDKLPVVGMVELPDDPRAPMPDGVLDKVRDFVTSQQPAIDLLREGAALPRCQFPVQWDGFNTLLPHLAPARQSARILVLRTWLDGEEGRPAGAVADIEDILALGRATGEEPSLISGLVGSAINSIAVYSADRLLARTEFAPQDLLKLQGAFAERAAAISFRDNMAGEFVTNQYTFQALMDGRIDLKHLYPGDGQEEDMWLLGWQGVRLKFATALPLRGLLKDDQAYSARYLTSMVEDAAHPSPAVLGRALTRRREVDASQSPHILSRMLLPALSYALQQCENTRAKLRSAAACVAALRYRKDNGDWPRSLDALVPRYIDAVPADPYTGMPLVYKISVNGIAVYSVGANGIDDGAPQLTNPAPKNTNGPAGQSYCDDAGFRIWK